MNRLSGKADRQMELSNEWAYSTCSSNEALNRDAFMDMKSVWWCEPRIQNRLDLSFV